MDISCTQPTVRMSRLTVSLWNLLHLLYSARVWTFDEWGGEKCKKLSSVIAGEMNATENRTTVMNMREIAAVCGIYHFLAKLYSEPLEIVKKNRRDTTIFLCTWAIRKRGSNGGGEKQNSKFIGKMFQFCHHDPASSPNIMRDRSDLQVLLKVGQVFRPPLKPNLTQVFWSYFQGINIRLDNRLAQAGGQKYSSPQSSQSFSQRSFVSKRICLSQK